VGEGEESSGATHARGELIHHLFNHIKVYIYAPQNISDS